MSKLEVLQKIQSLWLPDPELYDRLSNYLIMFVNLAFFEGRKYVVPTVHPDAVTFEIPVVIITERTSLVLKPGWCTDVST